MEVKIPSHIPALLNGIPVKDLPTGEEEVKFWRAVAYELSALLVEAGRAVHPQVSFNDFRQAGSQYIWEFAVNDLSRTRKNEINFHGQNTSQWLYAGAILLCDGKVSTHH